MKSMIPWIGGKRALANQIASMIPAGTARYIEVFGGGGSVLFSREKHAPFEVYNDANGDLVNLFRCAKYHCSELQREILLHLNSREAFNDIRARIHVPGFTDIQRAAMFFLIVRMSYGADTRTFGCAPKPLSADYLSDISARLQRVVIEHKDFADLIRVYDRPGTVFYCDPPYYGTEKYYDAAFSAADHERLKQCLTGISGRFILSYNDCPEIRAMYDGYDIRAVERSNNLASGRYSELIISKM